MSSKTYIYICLVIAALLGYEYAALNGVIHAPSVLRKVLVAMKYPPTTEPGKPLSFFLGWVGFGFICLTNLYILRKHMSSLHKYGKLPNWFEFHVFCGMLGPILIIFHSNLKIGGLVAVSFWSMVVSASSGIIGRYFFTQLIQTGAQLRKAIETYETGFNKYAEKNDRGINAEIMLKIRKNVINIGGVDIADEYSGRTGMLQAMAKSFYGDMRLRFAGSTVYGAVPTSLRKRLREYAVMQRRLAFNRQFKQVMGYWHSFHLPFAIFMYIVAVLHIIVALLFRTRS